LNLASVVIVSVACAAVGFGARRWQIALVVFAAWAVGLLIAAVAGAFAPTAEDNSLGVFLFTGVPTIVWPVCFAVGTLTRAIVSAHQH
jgi:hypothetical protein